MNLRFGAKLISLLFVVTFISSLIGYIAGVHASRTNETPKNAHPSHSVTVSENKFKKQEDIDSESTALSDNIITQSYILRENGGSLALYSKHSDGSETLYQSYDIPVNFLPSSDRELLKKGIETDALSDALQLVEDYSS